MDSTEVIIARLVLGYLKNEKCRSAYKEFLRTSKNLHNTRLSNSKYLPTRFVGLTLEDILSQYFEINKIVQGRLEATNYYDERHSKNSLVEQLLYLLNKVQSSRTSTPCPRSPPDSNLGETSPSHTGQISDVETTPAHTLPGNMRCISEDSYLHKTARRKTHTKYSKSDSLQIADKDDMSEGLAQMLLENREFHEKIAQTINKVAEKQNKVSAELDRTVKTVVKETEEDPIFDKILDEIIGSTTVVDSNKGIESSSTSSSTVKNTTQNFDCRSIREQKISESGESQDQNYQLCTDSKKMEEQNNEAVRSIIANARLTSNTQTNNQESQGNSEVILFDGSLDKYLITNTCNANTQTQPLQNPLYLNTTGSFLMVPSTVPTNVTGNLQIDTSKQIYFVNKPSTVSWNIPTIKTPNVITEQDILAMPTVIVNGDKQNKMATDSFVQAPILTTVKSALPTLIPKPTIEIPAEYLAQYNSQIPQQSNFKTEKTESELSGTLNMPIINLSTKTTSNVQNNTKSLPSDLLDETQGSHSAKADTCNQKSSKLTKDEPANKTPSPPEPVQKPTPKSGSHVRNLDFSTPPKITSTQKKAMRNSRIETPPFVHKKQAAKKLFKPQTDEKDAKSDTVDPKIDIGKKRKKSVDIWDADLRATILMEEDENQTPRKKQKSTAKSNKRAKKKGKKVADEVQQQLNTTEHDGALLQAALQTPIKAEAGNLEKMEDKSTTLSNQANKIEADCKNREIKTEISNAKKDERKQYKMGSVEDTTNKTILSPSKLNANKRNLLNTGLNVVDENGKFVTPEMIKENFHYPITHARNITSLLETPLKTNMIPKTPGLKTPMDPSLDPNLSLSSSILTPFTKMLEANLKGIDINSLPTPSMPITPTFPPFTPTIDLTSPYTNRPTDYSTSSSYYQPSDNEQNRSLEANVIELEKKPIKIHSDIIIIKEEILNSESKAVQNKLPHASSVNEHLNIFNKNVIGKKNLNLMERASSSSSSSSDESTSESSSENDNDSSIDWGKSSSDTIICRRKSTESPKRIYSLRNRTTSREDVNKKPVDTKEVQLIKKQPVRSRSASTKRSSKINTTKQPNKVEKTPQREVEKKETSSVRGAAKTPSGNTAQQKVLKELEEKRLRTIDKFKNIEKFIPKKPTPTKPLLRQPNGTFMKIKPIPNLTSSKRKPRKSASPKKNITGETKSSSKSDLHDSKNKDDPSLKISNREDDDKELTTAPVDKHINITKSAEKAEKSASDVEAQNLIEGLKERGIHLMHNKTSPTKKTIEPSNEQSLTDENVKDVSKLQSTSSSSKNDTTETSTTPTEKDLSTFELESELRDSYDMCAFTEENEHVIYDESKVTTRVYSDFDIRMLTKTFLGKVYVEEIDKEIDVPLVLTPFNTLLDIPPTTEAQGKEWQMRSIDKNKTDGASSEASCRNETIENSCNYSGFIKDVSNPTQSDEHARSDDDLMNFAIVGGVDEVTPEGSDSPKSTKKRKVRSEENSHTEKKCKTLLKKINVDSFLNNIHGET